MDKVIDVLKFLNVNWTEIIIIIGLVLALYTKIKSYMSKTKEEKIEIAKKALKDNLLKFMSDAEIEWAQYKKAGDVKRSQVITKIYQEYPILKEYINQEELIKYIDDCIDSQLKVVEKTINSSLS